jgi:periplasmic protein CpxP/Spy
MKYIAGIIAFIVTCPAFAQDGSKQAERLKKELQLTEQQFVSVKHTNEKFVKEITDIRNDETLSKESKRKKASLLKESRINEISSVLTAEQKTKWEQITAERREEKKKFKKQRREDLQALELTKDQKSRLKAEQQSFKAAVRDLKSSQTASKQEIKSKRLALKADHKENIKKILSEDQFAKWQTMKAQHPHKKKHRRN